MPELVGQVGSSLELHATILKRNPNRVYSQQEMDASNAWLRAYCDSAGSDQERAKEARRILKQYFDADIEELGCVADSEGRAKGHVSLLARLGRMLRS